MMANPKANYSPRGDFSFQSIFRSMPSRSSASAGSRFSLLTRRRNFSSDDASDRGFTYPLVVSISNIVVVICSNSPAFARCCASRLSAAALPRVNSYRQTATACPRFIEGCCSRVGMLISQWQCVKSSFERPRFSEPNKIATRPPARCSCAFGPASGRATSGCFMSRFRPAVVPITREQSATASATLWYCSADCKTADAPTAERASRNDSSKGFTTRNRDSPKLLMARAAAPMFRGLRVETRTTQSWSDSAGVSKPRHFTTTGLPWLEQARIIGTRGLVCR